MLLIVGLRVIAPLSPEFKYIANFSGIGAVALFGGAYFSNRWLAIIIPLAAMLISDTMHELFTGHGFHSGMPIIYGSFMLVSILGMIALRKVTPLKVVGAALASSLIFFLITNFAFFYTESAVADSNMGTYPHNWTGIIASYVAGIPFLRNQILGDLFYSGVLFGGFYLLQRRFETLKVA